eukprot:353690-Chlamydomonas_euryale.AAC.3
MPGGSRRTSACASSIAARLRSSGAAGAVVSAGDRLTTSSQCSPIAPARSASPTGTTTVRLAGDITTTGTRMIIRHMPGGSSAAAGPAGEADARRSKPPAPLVASRCRGDAPLTWTLMAAPDAGSPPFSCRTATTADTMPSSMMRSPSTIDSPSGSIWPGSTWCGSSCGPSSVQSTYF